MAAWKTLRRTAASSPDGATAGGGELLSSAPTPQGFKTDLLRLVRRRLEFSKLLVPSAGTLECVSLIPFSPAPAGQLDVSAASESRCGAVESGSARNSELHHSR